MWCEKGREEGRDGYGCRDEGGREGGSIRHVIGKLHLPLTCTALRLSLMCMRSTSSGTFSSDFRYCIRPRGCTHAHTHTHTQASPGAIASPLLSVPTSTLCNRAVATVLLLTHSPTK